VARKRYAARRREHARGPGATVEVVAPARLGGLVVERAQHAVAVDAVVGARPPVLTVLFLEEVDAVGVVGAHEEQPRGRVEARGTVVRASGLIGGDQTSVARRLFGGIGLRTSGFVHAAGPVGSGK